MPVKWTPERDRRILCAILEGFDIENNAAATAYVKKYGTGGDEPTHMAVAQRIKAIKKEGGVPAKGQAAAPKTPIKKKVTNTTTPINSNGKQRVSAAKTPATYTASKRKQSTMSDEDIQMETQSDSEEDNAPRARRTSTPRRSKATRVNYEESDAGDVDGELEQEDEDAMPNGINRVVAESVNVDQVNGLSSLVNDAGAMQDSLRRKKLAAIDPESDVSEFDPRA